MASAKSLNRHFQRVSDKFTMITTSLVNERYDMNILPRLLNADVIVHA